MLNIVFQRKRKRDKEKQKFLKFSNNFRDNIMLIIFLKKLIKYIKKQKMFCIINKKSKNYIYMKNYNKEVFFYFKNLLALFYFIIILLY